MNISTLSSKSGLRFEVHPHGAIRRIDCGDVLVNLFPGTALEGGPANLVLRRRDGGKVTAWIRLLGPESPVGWRMHEQGMTGIGVWDEIGIEVVLCLADEDTAWSWRVRLTGLGNKAVECDLLFLQDVGIAHYGAVRLNEYYVSQYVDHQPLEHSHAGWVVASRQNQPVGGRFPWLICGSRGRAVSYATDALQVCGLEGRIGDWRALSGDLPGKRLQGEHSMVALQEEALVVKPGETAEHGFFVVFRADHPEASSRDDLAIVEAARARVWPLAADATREVRAFTRRLPSPMWPVDDLDEDSLRKWCGDIDRHAERVEGVLWSCFPRPGCHVVTRAKEAEVLRPHGQLLRSGSALVPDEGAMTSTVWMNGVFHSMITQGHVSINRFLSTCHGYVGLFHMHGLRVFLDEGGSMCRLGMPSAFEMTSKRCRWIYQNGGSRIEVSSEAAEDMQELRFSLIVAGGGARRFLISHHIAMNGDDGLAPLPLAWERDAKTVRVRSVPGCDVGHRFPNGSFEITVGDESCLEAVDGPEAFEGEPVIGLRTNACMRFSLSIRGRLTDGMEEPVPALKPPVVERADDSRVSQLTEVLPWFADNALVHFLSPRGLEQYSGGGWGTRDVCQGPLELLFAFGRMEPVRDMLLRVFRQQNPDGDWPQWFMFFERERGIRPGDSHGDIVFWPLVALGTYLRATGDASVLDEAVPFFDHNATEAESASIRGHVDRALALIGRRVVPGTGLAAYGHGDWNDSLQPLRPEMRERLCSSWTVTLHHQMLRELAGGFRTVGLNAEADAWESDAVDVRREFQSRLMPDGVVAGLVDFEEDGVGRPLLHPRDEETGIRFSLLPMIHAIIQDMFIAEDAARHLSIIRENLLAPDGAHLFDRPLTYRGGVMRRFQRAESASYFGREIGNMYTHAHLRYAEALARVGDGEGLLDALSRVNPVAVRGLVGSAAPRQSNCYYSSSDPAFADRYEANDGYGRAMTGDVAYEGGWRVYSSGAGIAVRLIVQCLLGIRRECGAWVIDPVMPPACDGLQVKIAIADRDFQIIYQVGSQGHGPVKLEADGKPLAFTRETNPYRVGGVRVNDVDLPDSSSVRLAVCLA